MTDNDTPDGEEAGDIDITDDAEFIKWVRAGYDYESRYQEIRKLFASFIGAKDPDARPWE